MDRRPGIEYADLTDIGCQREQNEDSSGYWEPNSEDGLERRGRLAIVADGMGGYEGGQEASRIAVEVIEEMYAAGSATDIRQLLIEAFQEAHRRIQTHARQHPELHGMGTTATAVVLQAKHLYYAHVGDSRLYQIRGGKLSRLSPDHSYVGRLVEHGVTSPEDAEKHPQRHILTSALGAGSEILPETPDDPIGLQTGD